MDSQEIFNWIQSHITGRNMSSQDELWIHSYRFIIMDAVIPEDAI